MSPCWPPSEVMDPGPEPPRLRTSSREAAGAGTHRALSKGQKLALVEPLDPADHGQRTQRAEERTELSQEWAASKIQTVGKTAVRWPGFLKQ